MRLCLPGVIAFGALQLYALAVTGTLGGTGNAKLQFFQEDQPPLEDKVAVLVDNVGLYFGPIIPWIVLSWLAIRRKEMVLLCLFWAPVVVFYTLLFPGGFLHYFFRYQHPILPFVAAFAGGGLLLAYNYFVGHRDWVLRGLVVGGLVFLAASLSRSTCSTATSTQRLRWRPCVTSK